MATRPQRVSMMPPLAPWMRTLIIGLLALYILELVLLNLSLLGDASLRIHGIGYGFEPWQPLTRFFVQGRENAIGVLIELAVLFFFLPVLPKLTQRQWMEGLAFTAVVATGLPMISEMIGVLPATPRTGWGFLIAPLIVVYGLANPKGVVNLMLVLPVPAWIFVWGTLFLAVFMLLASPGSHTLEGVAAWIGIASWWNYRGPGNHRRQLEKRADAIERELHRFEVLEGGKSDRPQGGQGDDWVH